MNQETDVAEARRRAAYLAADQSWSETAIGQLSIVITEAATNQLKHAGGGEIHIQLVETGGEPQIEVLALDRGPGVAGIDACLTDGYSTTQTSGNGLGAIMRLSAEFDIYSAPGKGTALVARMVKESGARRISPSSPAGLTVGSVRVPIRGESVCGDDWGLREVEGGILLLMADGLGHGVGAAQASKEAVSALADGSETAPGELLHQVHHRLRPTRGAAVAAALVRPPEPVRFAGLGNIAAQLHHPSKLQHLVSHNGTAGHTARKIQEFSYEWLPGALLIMHSDGITTNWRLDAYPGLAAKHPSLIAGVLYRDASRNRDDACIAVVKNCH